MELPVFILALLTTFSYASSLTTNYTPINPIHFKDITSEVYLYTNVLDHTYIEPYALDEEDLYEYIKKAFENPHNCLDDGDVFCKQEELYREILNNTRTLVLNEARSILFEMENTLKQARRPKRFLGHAIGQLLHNYCDVALMEDIQQIALDNSNMGSRINEIQDMLVETNLRNRKFEESTNRLKESLHTTFRTVFRSHKNYADRVELRSTLRTQIIFLIQHYNSIYEHCFRQSLPSNAINPGVLVSDLEAIQATVSSFNLRLAIPITSVEDYYKLRLTQCSFESNAIRMTIHVPLVPIDSAFKLYEPVYLPFKYFNQTCQVQSKESLLAVNTQISLTHVITDQYLRMCNVKTHLCRVPFSHMKDINSLCLHANFHSRPVEELRELCPFSCYSIPVERPLINSIGDYTYIITNLPPHAYLHHENGTIAPVVDSSTDVGALYLEVPCSSQLVLKESSVNDSFKFVVLIDRQLPCFEAISSSQHRLQRIIPYQWSVHKVSSSNSNLSFSFNELWKNVTPTQSYLTEAEFTAKIRKVYDLYQPPIESISIINIMLNYIPEILNAIAVALLMWKIRRLSRKLKKVTDAILCAKVSKLDISVNRK